jgi:acyl-CoA dehydrogenase
MLAEMAIEIDATRSWSGRPPWTLDRGRSASRECALAKRYAANMALKVTDNALQVLGGHGYVRDHPIELWLGTPVASRPSRVSPSFEELIMIDFELSDRIQNTRQMVHMVAEQMMRPISREYDEREHEKPMEFLRTMWNVSGSAPIGNDRESGSSDGAGVVRESNLASCVTIEELSWGDAGLYLSIPNAGLGGAAVLAAGTPEQKKRFLARFKEGEPKWGAMAITEPHCGSDSAAIQTTAVRDGDHWVLNGTKIFCTAGLMAAEKSAGFVVVWATLDKASGRAGIKSFVVEGGTPGMKVVKCEDKLGIRASDTAMIVFEDCRIPLDNLLGSAQVKASTEGFKGAMATFDATRPAGRGERDRHRAARRSIFTREALERAGVEIRYAASPARMTALERDFIEMEGDLEAARLLTWRAAWMMDRGQRNNLEACMAKPRPGSPSRASRRRRSRSSARSDTRASSCSRSGCAMRRSTTSSKARSRSTCSSSLGASSATRAKS